MKLTFNNIRVALENLCAGVNLNSVSSLFVIPGNHDLRLSGFICTRPGYRRGTKLFRSVFDKYYPEAVREITTKPKSTGCIVANDLITLKIVCLDSNLVDRSFNFATGQISDKELQKLTASKNLETRTVANPSEFRICLVHHHPLPVIDADADPEVAPNERAQARGASKVFRRIGSVFSWIGSIFPTFMGAQGNVFKRAGRFLKAVTESRVDLVLHGHQHHPQISILRYPEAERNYPLMVVGGGSLGDTRDRMPMYNVVRLFRNGNIDVVRHERTTVKSDVHEYPAKTSVKLFSDSGHRYEQSDWMRHSLINKPLREGEINGPSFCMAECDRITRDIRMHDDGSARYHVAVTNLRASDKDKPVPWLPMPVRTGSHATIESPKIKRGPSADRFTLCGLPDAADGRKGWRIEFSPPLTYADSVSLEYSYQIDNVFDFVTEYACNREPMITAPSNRASRVGREFTAFTVQAVVPRSLVQTPLFPESWKPPADPTVIVEDKTDHTDDDEKLHCQRAFFYGDVGRNIATLAVDNPLVGYRYGFEWSLDSKIEFEKRYDARVMATFTSLSTVNPRPMTQEVSGKLGAVHREFSGSDSIQRAALLDSQCVLSVFLIRNVGGGAQAPCPCLVRIASFPPSERDSKKFAGEGLIGKAHRSADVQIAHAAFGMVGYRLPATKDGKDAKPHKAIWCVPLRVPTIYDTENDGAPYKESPVYAVVCAHTTVDSGALYPKDADGSLHPSGGQGNDFVRQLGSTFNGWLCEQLLGLSRAT